ncbi:MAG: response regulator [Candidatus Thorarchaeota archaeon]|jgi:CheY-like chemotaxis protein
MKPTILVVEDNPDVLFNIQVSLEANNYMVETATTGKEAVAKLSNRETSPDLIVSDIMMPEMDGYEFYQVLANDPSWKEIPLLFLSALATPDDIRFAHILGVDDYITKPFKEEDLLAMIERKLKDK